MEDAGEEHLDEDLRQDPRRDHREAQDQGGEEEHHCFKESRRLRLEEQEELVAAIDQGFTIVYYKVPALLVSLFYCYFFQFLTKHCVLFQKNAEREENASGKNVQRNLEENHH